MTDTAPIGYEAEPTDVAAILETALGDIPDEPDPTIRFAQLGALGALYDAVVSGIADERAKAAAELAAQGLSFQQVASTLGLGSKARAQQLIERGRPLLPRNTREPFAQITPYTQEPTMTVTLTDMIEKIGASVSANGSELAEGIDVQAVAEEIHDTYGLIDIDAKGEDGEQVIPFEEYWAIVAKHDATQQDS